MRQWPPRLRRRLPACSSRCAAASASTIAVLPYIFLATTVGSSLPACLARSRSGLLHAQISSTSLLPTVHSCLRLPWPAVYLHPSPCWVTVYLSTQPMLSMTPHNTRHCTALPHPLRTPHLRTTLLLHSPWRESDYRASALAHQPPTPPSPADALSTTEPPCSPADRLAPLLHPPALSIHYHTLARIRLQSPLLRPPAAATIRTCPRASPITEPPCSRTIGPAFCALSLLRTHNHLSLFSADHDCSSAAPPASLPRPPSAYVGTTCSPTPAHFVSRPSRTLTTRWQLRPQASAVKA